MRNSFRPLAYHIMIMPIMKDYHDCIIVEEVIAIM
jgi:hypothetical protein